MSITDKRLTEIQARLDAATHEFLPVNGHPDDDECTNRADGTDDTYCGEPEAAHDVIPDEFSLDLADLLAEVHRLRDELDKVREITDEKVERACRAFGAATATVSSIPPGMSETAFIDGVGIQNRYAIRAALETVLGGGDDEC